MGISDLPLTIQIALGFGFGAVAAICWFFGWKRGKQIPGYVDTTLYADLQKALEANRIAHETLIRTCADQLRDELRTELRGLRDGDLDDLFERMRLVETKVAVIEATDRQPPRRR